MENETLLIYPWDWGFYEILHSAPPPNWKNEVNSDEFALGVDVNGQMKLLSSHAQIDEYVLGGEWEYVESLGYGMD